MPLFGRSTHNATAVNFIIDHLRDQTAQTYFEDSRLARFRELVHDRQTIAAAKEYCDVTGGDIAQAQLCVDIAKQLNA